MEIEHEIEENVRTIALTEKSNLKVNLVIAGALVSSLVYGALYADRVDARSLLTDKKLEAHLSDVEVRRDKYDKKMQFLMNSVIRMQAELNIRIPRNELQDIEE